MSDSFVIFCHNISNSFDPLWLKKIQIVYFSYDHLGWSFLVWGCLFLFMRNEDLASSYLCLMLCCNPVLSKSAQPLFYRNPAGVSFCGRPAAMRDCKLQAAGWWLSAWCCTAHFCSYWDSALLGISSPSMWAAGPRHSLYHSIDFDFNFSKHWWINICIMKFHLLKLLIKFFPLWSCVTVVYQVTLIKTRDWLLNLSFYKMLN